jgi:hypothetical protein
MQVRAGFLRLRQRQDRELLMRCQLQLQPCLQVRKRLRLLDRKTGLSRMK